MGNIPFAPSQIASSEHGRSIRDLLLLQGQQRQDAAMRSGEIQAQMWGNLGQIAGGAVQQYGAQKQEQKIEGQKRAQDEAVTARLSQWDGNDPEKLAADLTVIAGPDRGMALAKAAMGVRETRTNLETDPKKALTGIRASLSGIDAVDDEFMATTGWASIRPGLEQAAKKMNFPINLPEQWDPKLRESLGKANQGLGALLGDDQKAAAPPPLGSEADFVARYVGEDKSAAKILEARAEYAKAGRAPVKAEPTLQEIEDEAAARARGTNSVKPPPGQKQITQSVEAGMISNLSKQWTKASAVTKELQRNVTLMDEGLKAAKAGDLNAGSQAVLITFNKILDPTSVVRESEYARSAEGQALMQRIEGAYQALAKGGPGVTVGQLESYAKLAHQMAKATGDTLGATRKRIEATASRYEIPHELVIEDFQTPSDVPAAAPVATVAPGTKRTVKGKNYQWDGKRWNQVN